MISLTYLSSAASPFEQEDLEELLATVRAKNAAAGLTGMLLHVDGHFIQTLEGEEADVDRIFARIQDDGRHRNLIVALREEIETRIFPDWSMGFEQLTAEEASAVPGFNDYLDPGSELYRNGASLGRAGIFHRIFRDEMRYTGA